MEIVRQEIYRERGKKKERRDRKCTEIRKKRMKERNKERGEGEEDER